METHLPVLLQEVIDNLDIKDNGIYVDLTLGRAGHSQEILKRLKTGKLICFDKDIEALNQSKQILEKISSNFILIKSDFRFLTQELEKIGIYAVDGILADLGVSSPQLDNVNRGFSYSQNSDLDMRMDLDNTISAKEIVNQYSEDKLGELFVKNADVKFPKKIAKAIINNRPINTSFELVDILRQNLPAYIVRQKNPAKQIFQALRIAVNDELDGLKELLDQIPSILKMHGKLLIITFHSKEDKIVKEFYQKRVYQDPRIARLPIPNMKFWSQKVIYPSEQEIALNKRAHSAKLRIITKE
ncbi:MAG: 16S rRNA (cytosine(1402)-N(4))-methyltransferase RsmH [Metamycoplasma salivarium]